MVDSDSNAERAVSTLLGRKPTLRVDRDDLYKRRDSGYSFDLSQLE